MAATFPYEAAEAEVCCLPGPSATAHVRHFDAIYRAYRVEVARFARACGAPQAYCDDVVHEVFMIVHRRLHAFDGDNLPGWLYRITRRRVRDLRCCAWFRCVVAKRGELPEQESDTLEPAQSLEIKRSFELVERYLQRLSEGERVTLLLFELDGYSGEEIADIQGVSINTVFSRLRRARSKLGVLAGKRRLADGTYTA
jgi:RNA polymerase sigma-70 factor (ECF subfamily)